ncbi:transcription-repair coupling factor [Aerococcaceae bacterium zg-BR9]|uniref:transcription-repair coupling factor n=1 Tax=Aerococcaceae bacterium zg-1292 TaxID=2774330 RepID=UPI004064018D|nr:transcription-repair coupling factor [Aerococcaceae bacterium zg-BR9]
MIEQLNQVPFQAVIADLQIHLKPDMNQLVTGLDDSARAVLWAQLFRENPRQLLIVEPVATRLTQLVEDLQALLPDVPVVHFAVEESMALEFSFASYDNQMMRVEALSALASGEPCVVITSGLGLRKRLTPLEIWKEAQLQLSVGTEIERFELEKRLNYLGYSRETMVQSPGEYSIRGSIVDFYPLNLPYPVRVDFFDTEVDSIRYFDAETQASIENIDYVRVLPVKDLLFSLEEQKRLLPKLRDDLIKRTAKMNDESLEQIVKRRMEDHLDRLMEGEGLHHATAYLEYVDARGTTLIDYLSSEGVLIVNELDRVQNRERQAFEEDHFWIEQEVMKGDLLPGLSIKLSAIDAIKQAEQATVYCSVIQRGLGNLAFRAIHHVHFRSMNQFFNQMPVVKAEVDHWLHQDHLIQVVMPTIEEARKVVRLFEENEITPTIIQEANQPIEQAVNVVVGQLANGFELPLMKWVVLTEKELFNQVKRRVARQQNLSNAERIKSYNELEIGDYVVHINHGIGKYTGIDTIEINGVHRDMLAIVYQENARILIPVDQIHLLQKYVASEAKAPKLNKLGTTEWAKTKRKIATKIEDIADELIELYAKRESQRGYAFSKDTPEQEMFENAFAYVETQDQLRSAQEIKADMEKIRPMDRLLVGDVGYGKTEVAMRAAFKAVMDGKQVAFLVPTTILAQQHYNSLVERFADFPVNIGMLSRFVTKKQQAETIEKLALGQLDIVVGTHRVLSKDITFSDLGLLVVDEEQRFGVRHKERLKQLKSQVDVLTLTATPIPRTLHMSMIGVRDLSVIETPPSNRFPVQTYVMERNDGAIKSAIERELARGGQCFYLYNRVATIEQRANEIAELVPDARIAVAHGRMTEVQLETVLIDFIQGMYDILVTTTIIETGVDIPNANTLFIDMADHMGLSTLYQLRGRVGRTNRVAYAYLMYEPFKQLSEVSEKRLQAIQEFTELGSGFKIAMRDLSIRGAGNLLGKQQSGFIDSVGFDLYSQMLKEAVDMKRGLSRHKDSAASDSIEWDLLVDAYIPSTYIEDERQKIAIYKAIQRIESEEEYRKVQDELIDRFGEFPDEVADLLEIALIKYYGLSAGIIRIRQKADKVHIDFNEQMTSKLQGVKIFEAMQDIPVKTQVAVNEGELRVTLNIKGLTADKWLAYLKRLARNVHVMNQETVKENETDK